MEQPQRIALVTGAARGIGLAIAEQLSKQGHKIVLTDRLELVEQAAAGLRAQGLAVEAFRADTADAAGISSLLAFIRERYGRLDILVNNAGISPKHNGGKLSVTDTPLAEFREIIRVNLTGPFQMCRAFVPLMKSGQWGRIVAISSLAGRTGSRWTSAPYSASKAGLIGFSRVIAEEVGRYGITVNCVAPGRIETPMSNESGDDVQRKYAAQVPVRRLGRPEDISSAVSFLVSDAAKNITGATLDVNGGVFMP